MKQPKGYPKTAFVFMQCYVVVEDGKEVVQHLHDVPLAFTTNENVAELVLAKMKEREGQDTLVRSTVQPMPSAVLDMMDNTVENQNLDNLLEIAERSSV